MLRTRSGSDIISQIYMCFLLPWWCTLSGADLPPEVPRLMGRSSSSLPLNTPGHLNTDWVVHEAPAGSLSDEVETTHEHAGQTNYGIQGPRYQSSESISLPTHPAWCGTRDLCPGNLGHL